MTKPRVLFSIPNTGWIHREVVKLVPLLLSDQHSDVTFIAPEARPYEKNMAQVCHLAVEEGYDFLFSLDSDTVPLKNPLDLVREDRDVIACAYPLMKIGMGDYPFCWSGLDYVGNGNYKEHNPKVGPQQVDAVGSGAILISRRVLCALEGQNAWEREWTPDGRIKGTDFGFCEKVRATGFTVWIHYDYPAEHYKEMGLLQAQQAFYRGD